MAITSLEPTTGHYVWRLSMKWRAQIDRAMLALGLTHAQYSLLASLYGLSRSGAAPSQRELADFSGLDVIYVSKLVKALEREGLVARTTSRRDPRAVELRLTDLGTERIEAAIPIVRNFLDNELSAIGGSGSEDDLTLRRILKTLLGEPPADDTKGT